MGTRTWLVPLLLAVALLAACGPLPSPTPADTPTPTPTLAPTATPTATPTPTPVPPTPTPPLQREAQPIPTPFPPSIVALSGDIAFAGVPLELRLDIFQPWERLRLAYTSPDGVQGATILRADEKGHVLWRRETNKDATDEWRLSIERSGVKPPHTLTYRLEEAAIPLVATPAPPNEDGRFLLFETGDARVFFLADVHTATAVAVAAYYSAALPQIEAYVGIPLPEKTDFYLVRGQARLIEEVRLGGGSEFTHVEGISLAGPGYRRPGVYLNVAPSESELPLLVVHEAVHQVVARVSRTRPPVWVDEGLADYMGYLVSKEAFPYEAAAWRRAVRASVRRAAQQDGALLPLDTLNEAKGWAGGSEEEITLRYAQAYLAMDYLLERSGLASLRSLFHQVRLGAAGSAAVEAAYGLSLEQVWAGILASLREPTPEEREAAALADYARATLALLREEGETRRAWTAFARQSALPRQEREERDLFFLETYREHQRRLEAARPPEEARTIHELARRGMKEMAEAMSSFLLYERTGDRSLLADGNERVPLGALWADAASDLLVILLGERRVSLDEAAL